MMSEKLLTREEFLKTGFRKLGDLISTIKEGEHSDDEAVHPDVTSQNNRACEGGMAVINRKKCLSWSQGIICDLCRYKCPENAIEITAGRMPAVIDSKCNGCGQCRYICPTSPKAVEIVSA